MLMEEIDQRALRDHLDERFDEQKLQLEEHKRQLEEHKRQVDERFRQMDQRFIEVHAAIKDIGKDTKLMVFSICGAFAVVAIAAMMEAIRG